MMKMNRATVNLVNCCVSIETALTDLWPLGFLHTFFCNRKRGGDERFATLVFELVHKTHTQGTCLKFIKNHALCIYEYLHINIHQLYF